MVDEAIIVRVDRLRDDLEALRTSIRKKYSKSSQISSKALRDAARLCSEAWIVEIAPRPEVSTTLQPNVFADIGVAFQKLLTAADHVSMRRDYDNALDAILEEFNARVVFPLKQRRTSTPAQLPVVGALEKRSLRSIKRMFVGHSFNTGDKPVVVLLTRLLAAYGVDVVTGEKPSADSVSDKVKKRIEQAEGFLGLYSCRDKIAKKKTWTTSAWVIEEKAYALAKNKKLILLKEKGVESIGGLQGDFEYLEFVRDDLADLIVRLVELFEEPVTS